MTTNRHYGGFLYMVVWQAPVPKRRAHDRTTKTHH
jgi:hypothetical protein